MAKKFLTINIGSRSKKYSLFDESGALVDSVHLEDERYRDRADQFFNQPETIAGIRIVAAGEYFLEHRQIDGDYLVKLEQAAKTTPIHLEPVLNEIRMIMAEHPEMPLYGISDSAFLASRPLSSRLYGIAMADTKNLELYRYGYHGLSIESAMKKLQAQANLNISRVIVCHLGGGMSIVALKNGRVIDSSMGYSPLEGPVMSSRVGNIDAAAVLALLRAKQISPDELEKYFNHDCGLKGISEISQDTKQLLEQEKAGEQGAQLALEVMTQTIRKQIGAMMALLGGVDILVFTATIGQRSAILRTRIVDGWKDLGIIIDREKNESVPDPITVDPLWIEATESKTKIAVLNAAEDKQIYEVLQHQL